MNYLALAQRVKRESGRSSTGLSPTTFVGASQPDLDLFNAVADALRDIENMPRNWKWMWAQTLAPLGIGNVAYTPASLGAPTWAYWKPESVDYKPTAFDPSNTQTEWKLTFVDYDTFAQSFLRGAHTPGAPQYWSIGPDGSFLVGPKPDIAYTLRADYFTVPQTLAVDGDIPRMPDRFHMLIVWRALESVAITDNAPEKVAKAERMAGPIETTLILDQGERLRMTARTMR